MDKGNTISAKNADPALIQRLEKTYGPVDIEHDFLSGDLKTYYKTDDIDDEKDITHKIIPLAGFGDALNKLYKAVQAVKSLVATKEGKLDPKIVDSFKQLKDVFNKYRTHIRKSYPDQYGQIKNQLKEISSTVAGGNYNTPKFVKKYKYKLKEGIGTDVKQFHQERMSGFDRIGDLLGQIQPLLKDAKQETEEFYKTNPLKQEVLYSTDIIEDYLNDIIKTLRPE